MNPFILVADIGNTSTSVGLYRAGKVLRVQRLVTARTTVASVKAAVRRAAGRSSIAGVCIASVVPDANPVWKAALRRPIVWVDHTKKLGVRIAYPNPATIGADRLANAAGGIVRYGAPLLVADFGTAVTFDVVTKDAAYIGGVIAPGLPLMFTYLAEKTAKLPAIGPGPAPRGVGKNTADAMRLGALWGYRGMVREIIAELRKLPGFKKARLCATGGFAKWVVRGLKPAMTVDQDLTLFGIGIVFELNGRGAH